MLKIHSVTGGSPGNEWEWPCTHHPVTSPVPTYDANTFMDWESVYNKEVAKLSLTKRIDGDFYIQPEDISEVKLTIYTSGYSKEAHAVKA